MGLFQKILNDMNSLSKHGNKMIINIKKGNPLDLFQDFEKN